MALRHLDDVEIRGPIDQALAFVRRRVGRFPHLGPARFPTTLITHEFDELLRPAERAVDADLGVTAIEQADEHRVFDALTTLAPDVDDRRAVPLPTQLHRSGVDRGGSQIDTDTDAVGRSLNLGLACRPATRHANVRPVSAS